jgi:DNA-directed RNA polymerase I subunit RPA2
MHGLSHVCTYVMTGSVVQIRRDLEKKPLAVKLEESYFRTATERMPDIGKKFEYLLNTGNLTSRSGLDLSQSTGFTVVAEKLNFFRYLSHFRSVHRGAYFMQLRTTAVRKLLPESFGFMCPVHTPDGSPCGLLNHLTHRCNVVAEDVPEGSAEFIATWLAGAGMADATPDAPAPRLPGHICVQLDGRVAGHIAADRAAAVVAKLRSAKAAALRALDTEALGAARAAGMPYHTEVCLLPCERGGPYPVLMIQTQQARLARPVRQVASRQVELIGSLEQFNMHIRCASSCEFLLVAC